MVRGAHGVAGAGCLVGGLKTMRENHWCPGVLSVSITWNWSPWTPAGVGADSRCFYSEEDREGSRRNYREFKAAYTGAGPRVLPGWEAALHHCT